MSSFSTPPVVTSAGITDGSVANADIATDAAIALSKLAAVTASRALASDGSGVVAVTSVTSTELGYVSGVTSALQTQLGTKAPLASPTFTGTVLAPDLKLNTAGNGLYVKEGSNATMGTLTLNGASTVTVNTTKVTANSRIFLTVQEPAGTPAGIAYVFTRSAGTSFGVRGIALDTSVVAWLIVEPA